MSHSGFLEELNEDELRELVRKEGMKVIPKNYEKEDMIKFLDGVLTAEKIKKYSKEYSEREIERDIHIHEKIKEKSSNSQFVEETKVTISREKKILDLMKRKIQKEVLSVIANKLHEKEPEGSKQSLYENMSDTFLQKAYDIFVEGKMDRSGRNFEYLCANYLLGTEEVEKLETDHDFHGIGEVDIVGFDDNMLPVIIAECKDRTALKEDVDKWITNTIGLYDKFSSKIEEKHRGKTRMTSYFFTSERITQEVLERYKSHKVKDDGTYQKYPVITPKSNLFIFEVKGTKFERKFPKK